MVLKILGGHQLFGMRFGDRMSVILPSTEVNGLTLEDRAKVRRSQSLCFCDILEKVSDMWLLWSSSGLLWVRQR